MPEAVGAELETAEPVCDGDLCSVELKKDQPAPYDGQLLSPELAIELGQAAEEFDKRLAIESKFLRREFAIEIDHQKWLRKNDAERALDREDALRRRIPSWYEHPAIVVPATVVGTVGLLFLSRYLWTDPP